MPKSKYTDDQLFQMYVSLGEERTLKILSEVTGYGLQTLNNRSSKGKWRVRLAELTDQQEKLVTALVSDIQNEVRISEAVVNRGLSERILDLISQALPNLKPPENPRDLKTLVDTYRLIQGQATSIEQLQVQEVSEEQLASLSPEELEVFNKFYA